MDANETHREKARGELHKNAASYFEHILEATPHETSVRPLISYLLKNIQERQKDACDSAGETRTKFISDVLL